MENFMDWQRQYEIPEDVTYFNSAGHCILPSSSQNLGIQQIVAQSTPWKGYGDESWDLLELRTTFSNLINSLSVDCIATCHSTSLAMSTAAHNAVRLGLLNSSKKVIVVGQEMGSGVLPWQWACTNTGAVLSIIGDGIENNEDTAALDKFDWTEVTLAALAEEVAVVCVPNVHWCDGAYLDLVKIASRIQEFPVATRPWLVVDGTQSIGVLPFDVQAIKPVFVACSVHKWLNGPFGMSITYLDPQFHSSWTSVDHHDRNLVGCESVAWDCLGAMVKGKGYPTEAYPDARVVNSGGHPNPVTVSMVRQSLGLVQSWGPSNLQAHCLHMRRTVTAAISASSHGCLFYWKPESKCCGHILGLYLALPAWRLFLDNDVDKLTLGTFLVRYLKDRGIYVVMRGGCLRVSFYIFNTEQQCAAFATALSEASDAFHQQQHVQASSSLEKENTLISKSSERVWSVLVTGSAGWLGQFVWQALQERGVAQDGRPLRLWAAYHGSVPDWVPEDQRVRMDLSNPHSVSAAVSLTRPDCVLHLAAMSSVLGCENDPARAAAVNCCGALVATLRLLRPQCVCVFTSTDLVYDGEHAPYPPPPHLPAGQEHKQPLNVYGATKLAMERKVTSGLCNGYALRLSNMIGPAFVYRAAGTKFLQFLQQALTKRERIGLKDSERRSFVYVQDVVQVLLALGLRTTPRHGDAQADSDDATSRVLNVGGPVGLSRLQLAGLLSSAQGIELQVMEPGQQVALVPGEEAAVSNHNSWVVDRLADAGGGINPRDVTMVSEATFSQLGLRMTPLEEAIPLCLK